MDGTIEIQFLQGTTNSTFNNKSIDISNTNSKNDYVVHPAFKFGDKELQGIWVAKYEASRTDATDTGIGETQILSFKENVFSITDYDLTSAMYYCRDMEKQNIYGWNKQNGTISNTGDIIDDNNNFDTHLIKNIEWGAVTYLAQSKYGINTKIEPNTSQISGKGGKNSTTTGNETGIYDMAGQNSEFVSAYRVSDNISAKCKNMATFNDKYKDKYTTSFSSDKYGDSIFETASGATGSTTWYSSSSSFLGVSNPFFTRGNILKSGNIYSFYETDGRKGYSSFRATIVKNNDI